MSTQRQPKSIIDTLKIPKFRDFAELLHDRLHAILYHIEDWENKDKEGKETTRKFTLITNLRDRSLEELDKDVLIYGGANTQRQILEEWKKPKEDLTEHWEYLNDFAYSPNEEFKEFITYDLYQKFKKGEVSIADLNIGSLEPYFRRMSNPVQIHEKAILQEYFTLKGKNADFFLSIPIVSLGTFDGVAHIIFQKDHLDYFLDKEQQIKNKAYNDQLEKEEEILTQIEEYEQKLDQLDSKKKEFIDTDKIQKIEAQEREIKNKRKELETKKEKKSDSIVLNKQIEAYEKQLDQLSNRKKQLLNIPEIQKIEAQEKEIENAREQLKNDKDVKPEYPVKRDVLIRIIKLFSFEYDSLVLDWDLVGENIQETSKVKLGRLNEIDYYEKDNKNPILKELKFPTYYRISLRYLTERLEQNNQVPLLLQEQREALIKQQRVTAIITILVDSYAHNISAHSLTALNWWFRERAIWMEGKDIIKLATSETDNRNPLTKYGIRHLSKELYPLFKFLMEKGAFWSGITRKTNFGGRRSNWYEMLWFDFINSPLYLGTIANTEGINKINIHITIYEKDEEQSKFYRQRIVKEKNGKALSGHFVSIDLWKSEKTKIPLEEKYQELKDRSAFVEIGADYEKLRNELAQTKVFLSGGVVGKHSFFTIIENEIRNVKHHDVATKKHMNEHGLDLHLSFQSINVKREQSDRAKQELYQVGVWIGHPTDLFVGHENKEMLLLIKMRGLAGDIMEEKNNVYKPKLGGNYQDKICAGMLFNNDFGKVQNRKTVKDRTYFPWIVVATSEEKTPHLDFELTPQNTGLNKSGTVVIINETEIKKAYKHTKGYTKKYLYLWQGEEIYHIKGDQDFEWENIARFRFVNVPSNFGKAYDEIKAKGVVRLLRKDTLNDVIDAYKIWLAQWQKTTTDFVIDLKEGKTLVGSIIYHNNKLTYFSYNERRKEESKIRDIYSSLNKVAKNRLIQMAHGGKDQDKNDIWRFRSHGTAMQQIFKVKNSISETEKIDELELYELFEALITNVCIFDNRVYDRLRVGRRDFYRENLKFDVRQEDKDEWNKLKKKGFSQYHFLVVHLSFIENMKDNKYSEKNIVAFVKEEILNGGSIDDLEKNFVLVITTGRGRMEWWSNLEKTNLTRFTTFRPIESILTAVEDALQKKDDFDLKYNIAKVLFGS